MQFVWTFQRNVAQVEQSDHLSVGTNVLSAYKGPKGDGLRLAQRICGRFQDLKRQGINVFGPLSCLIGE